MIFARSFAVSSIVDSISSCWWVNAVVHLHTNKERNGEKREKKNARTKCMLIFQLKLLRQEEEANQSKKGVFHSEVFEFRDMV